MTNSSHRQGKPLATSPFAGMRTLASGLLALAFSACAIVIASDAAQAKSRPFSIPFPTRPLSAFGVEGGTGRDETATLQAALDRSSDVCLDGGGSTYFVNGTLRASNDVCLVNLRLVQRGPRTDTRPYFTSPCPRVDEPVSRNNCGDTTVGGTEGRALMEYATRRTLFASPAPGQAPLRVTLVRVAIDRGSDPLSGSRDNSAGLWIANASQVRLKDIEITGDGKGHGLLIANSEDVQSEGLYVHDLVWAPYAGDAPLALNQIRAQGWNRPTVREVSFMKGPHGVQVEFAGRRVQEQLSGITVVASRHVTFRDTRVANCLARFDIGDLPWQADGINIGDGSSDVRILRAQVSRTWEGIDLVGSGGGLSEIVIDGATVADSFSVGIKMGNRLSGTVLRNSSIDGAGLAGVMIYGAVTGARLDNVIISGIGNPARDAAAHREWLETKAGLSIARGDISQPAPNRINLSGVTVRGGSNCGAGLLDARGTVPALSGLSVSGCKIAKALQ